MIIVPTHRIFIFLHLHPHPHRPTPTGTPTPTRTHSPIHSHSNTHSHSLTNWSKWREARVNNSHCLFIWTHMEIIHSFIRSSIRARVVWVDALMSATCSGAAVLGYSFNLISSCCLRFPTEFTCRETVRYLYISLSLYLCACSPPLSLSLSLSQPLFFGLFTSIIDQKHTRYIVEIAF